jgi:hypothetical protein
MAVDQTAIMVYIECALKVKYDRLECFGFYC